MRVREPLREADLEGKEGTITRRRDGNARFVAVDVLLDDGTSRLFWHHELEELGDEA